MLDADLLFSEQPLNGQPADLVFGSSTGASTLRPSDLLFSASRLNGSTADLLFGDDVDPGELPVDAMVAVRGLLPTLQVRVGLALGIGVATRASLPLLRATIRVHYATDTARPTVGSVTAHWQAGSTLRTGQSHAWQDAQKLNVANACLWRDALTAPTSITARWSDTYRSCRLATVVNWQDGGRSLQSTEAKFQEALRHVRASIDNYWQTAAAVSLATAVVFQEALRSRRADVVARWQDAVYAHSGLLDTAQNATAVYSHWSARWQDAMQPGNTRLPELPPVVRQPCYVPSPNLLFSAAWPASSALVFYCEGLGTPPGLGNTFYILPARFYMITHNLIARRLPDLAEVPLYDCTLSADVGSFAWQFSATGPDSLFNQLAPTAGPASALPQLLEVTLDGLAWVFLVESLKRDHTFGKTRVNISGRSQTALVGSPWTREAAYNNAAAANAQQLAAQALDLSGVALDWGITDWLVPSNAWSYNGSRLAAVQAIANAAGGYVQSHRSAATLQVRHPYPPRPSGDNGGPWNWGIGAADVQLAADAVITSGIERRDGADINAVYASGTTQGVLALIKRAGTAGDKLAALQTDALITASQAAEQRGLATLGKAGPQYAVSLELPVLTGAGQPGVIDVGSLVQLNTSTPWRGRVRSVQVNAAMPTARQTITLERHV